MPLSNTVRRWTRTAAVVGAGVLLTTSALGTATAQAAPPAAKGAPGTAVSMTPDGTVTVEKNGRKGKAQAASGARGSNRMADARGYSTKRKFPSNVRMLGAGPSPASVIGSDSRTQVTNTTSYPHRVVGKLTFKKPNGGTYGCTAFLYGNNTVGTAGHCLYSPGQGWHSNFVFWPGKNGASNPYGSCGWSSAHTVNGWINSGNPGYDYGAIRLNCTIGNTTGWIGMKWQSASYNGTWTNITGYPGDKPYGTMWQAWGSIAQSGTLQLFYSTDMYNGQSGSAVRVSGCGTYCAIAVNAYNVYGGSPYNRGTRITQGAFDNFMNWKS